MAEQRKIVRAGIHPAIGIARVGNSPDEFFIGPELPYPTAGPDGGYKDATGALKRQAAQFRIYGYDELGNPVRELTIEDAEIVWTVHVANKKAAWYNFDVALDIPEATPSTLRNASFQGNNRAKLVIDPGERSVSGANRNGSGAKFDTGTFLGTPVYLGELRTDEKGRLIFLGGHGVSNSPFPDNTAYTFANNDGWHDDTSDGPVSAKVTFEGIELPVDGAWVVVAPPNYAPDIISVQTMYDVIRDASNGSLLKAPPKPSFTEDIFPIFSQFSDSQWVNYGFFVQFGWQAPYDFSNLEFLNKLAQTGNEYAELRRQIFNNFRDPSLASTSAVLWPWMYGDNMNIPASETRQYLALTKLDYGYLKQWAAGDFIPDWNPGTFANPRPQSIEELPIARQPATLDKAALYFCLGGPFHPGCEMTWPMRHSTMYSAAFRIRRRAKNQPEPDYGDSLSPTVALGPNGPLYANGPGDITRWMAVPWQTDTASCRAGYESKYDPYVPTFWPARVPNHVLTEENYFKVMDESLPEHERVAAFNLRATWYRWLTGGYVHQINEMVADFGKLGVVERKDGPVKNPLFPPTLYVESKPGFEQTVPLNQNTFVGVTPKVSQRKSE